MRTKLLLPVSAVLLCAACTAGIFETSLPEPYIYRITAAPAQPAPSRQTGFALPVDLAIARPIVRPGLFTERIALHRPGHRVDYFAGSRWGATADLVVQNLLIDTLRSTGRLRSVQSDLSAFSAQFLLQTELQDFQAEYDGEDAPVAHVRLVCTVGRLRARQPLTEFTAEARVQAADNTMGAVVAAFEEAWRAVGQTVTAATLDAVERAQARDVSF